MYCLRCGRETQEDHVFCQICREQMEQEPVRPGTAVMLPRRREETYVKKGKRHVHSPLPVEDQLRRLKKQRFVLTLSLILVLAIAAGTSAVLGVRWNRTTLRPGQNYSAVETEAPQESQ